MSTARNHISSQVPSHRCRPVEDIALSSPPIPARMVSVAVQPPSQTQTNQPLYPPVVVRTRTRADVNARDGCHLFAMAVLLDAEGDVLEGQLGGTQVVSGYQLDDDHSNRSSRTTITFAFPDLSIMYAGSYTIRIDIYRVDYDAPEGAVLIEQTHTNGMDAYDEDVAGEQPSSDERALLQKLKDNGHSLPSEPN